MNWFICTMTTQIYLLIRAAGEGLIEEGVQMATADGILKPHDHVVIISRSLTDEYMIKVITVDETGKGIKEIRPKSLMDMIKAAGNDNEDLVAAGPAMGGKPNLARGSMFVGTMAVKQ